MTVPDAVVFDAEPLLAHADDEPGSTAVETYLDAVADDRAAGFANSITLAAVRYVLASKYDRSSADEYLNWARDLGTDSVDVDALWLDASEYVLEYHPALGDSLALATAEHADATLLVGGDDDYDDVTAVSVERFRDGPA